MEKCVLTVCVREDETSKCFATGSSAFLWILSLYQSKTCWRRLVGTAKSSGQLLYKYFFHKLTCGEIHAVKKTC